MSSLDQPRLSASVILLDQGPAGSPPFRLFLLQRAERSRFMPGRFVFPGGRWEPADGDPAAEGLKRCALRELWEEAGVILATDPAKVAALAETAREAARRALGQGQAGLEEALAGLGLAPDLAGLRPYARWITPPAREQRFDATFFLARLPAGQTAGSADDETSQGLWLSPAEALAANETGRVGLAPPQVRLVGELAGFASLEELWAQPPRAGLAPVEPVLWSDGTRRVILLPWDVDHPAGRPADPASLGRACPASQATRLVHLEGRWLPHSCYRE